jgi:uncharacterized protein (TIGR03437 family)
MARSFIAGLALILSSAAIVSGQVYTVSTVAGNGTPGFADGPALSSQLDQPGQVFLTGSGSIYIADSLNYRVRLLSGGNLSTIAGNGTPGYGGDAAAATAAFLNNPQAVVVDSSGNIYIADTGNNVIRKVTSGGTITTYAGNQGFGAGHGGDGGPATNATLCGPLGLAIDSANNLYIADPSGSQCSGSGLIRKVTASTGAITTVVGSSAPTLGLLQHPTAIALDAAGNMYIADSSASKIFKFTASTGKLSTFAGTNFGFSGDGNQAAFAQLGDPQGVAIDAAGNVYIADSVNNRIRKVATNGIITTIAGTGKQGYTGDGGLATSAQFYSPDGVALDNAGNVYVSDTHNSVIRVLQPTLPTISSGGVGNAFSFKPQISPGAFASVFGTGFGLATISPAATPNLPTSAGGVSVTVNGLASALSYVSAGQINFQVPWETAVGTASVVVTVNGGPSNALSVPVVSAGPGLYSVAENADFSLNTPSNAAAAGSTIIAYLTGSGPVNPTPADGAPSPSNPLAQATSTVTATIGTATAQVSFVGLTPGTVGLLQANIVIPAGLTPGAYPLTVTIGGQASNTASINVK